MHSSLPVLALPFNAFLCGVSWWLAAAELAPRTLAGGALTVLATLAARRVALP